MATFVLVAGAWLGGWAWSQVADDLRGRGHLVHPATLTGLGERSHLSTPSVGLQTHVDDVVNLIAFEDLTGVTLVGHSYAGAVVTAAAPSSEGRVARTVYVDAAPVPAGTSVLDFYPADGQEAIRRSVAGDGGGWQWPFPGFDVLGTFASLDGLDARARAAIEGRATPHPFATITDPVVLGQDDRPVPDMAAIVCNDGRALLDDVPDAFGDPRRTDLVVEELATGHWPMFSEPERLAAILDSVARRP